MLNFANFIDNDGNSNFLPFYDDRTICDSILLPNASKKEIQIHHGQNFAPKVDRPNNILRCFCNCCQLRQKENFPNVAGFYTPEKTVLFKYKIRLSFHIYPNTLFTRTCEKNPVSTIVLGWAARHLQRNRAFSFSASLLLAGQFYQFVFHLHQYFTRCHFSLLPDRSIGR